MLILQRWWGHVAFNWFTHISPHPSPSLDIKTRVTLRKWVPIFLSFPTLEGGHLIPAILFCILLLLLWKSSSCLIVRLPARPSGTFETLASLFIISAKPLGQLWGHQVGRKPVQPFHAKWTNEVLMRRLTSSMDPTQLQDFRAACWQNKTSILYWIILKYPDMWQPGDGLTRWHFFSCLWPVAWHYLDPC